MYIKKMNRDFTFELCKINKDVIGVIDKSCVISITVDIQEIDKIELKFEKYIYSRGKRIINPLWYELKEERYVCLNNEKYFVLKNYKFNKKDDIKTFTAYSLEYKLGKIDIDIEDIAIHLLGKNEEENTYSLNELLFNDTGWSFGHIDESILYDIKENGDKVEKLRWQESVNMRWYDFIKNDICESFECIADYDTKNKLVNLYDIKTYGENIELYLSMDNYLRDIERVGSTENLVTRLYLIGNEEMDIIGATVSGYPYIEDYSYFMDNKEMSEELIKHLKKYYEMVDIREKIWYNIFKEKQDKIVILNRKKDELFDVLEKIRANTSIKESHDANGDEINSAIISDKITKLNDQRVILEVEIRNLEKDIDNLDKSMIELSILCKRETSTDEDGRLIFNEKTLNELKDYIYQDTYTNDSFLDVQDLLKSGRRELDIKCKPTKDYNLDLKNFLTRVLDNGFNKNWNGELGLGDIVILYDEDIEKEEFLYVNGYTQYPNAKENEKEMDIVLSNKKVKDSNLRFINDRLKEAEMAYSLLNRKVHLLNKQKYNRINLTKKKIDGAI